MSTYLIGDIHGCYDQLKIILKQVCFNPTVDTLWLTGDLVARGPNSLGVLRLIYNLGKSVRLVLGNHDLHLLAMYYTGIKQNRSRPKDYINSILKAPDVDELMNWLRHQPILQVDEDKKIVMAHAGITPQWDLATANQCAREVETILKSNDYQIFLNSMYGDMPNNWHPNLSGLARLRFITNVFTRMRYCFLNGQLEMNFKDIPEKAPHSLRPWFMLPMLVSDCYSIVFGHWASLDGKGTPAHIYGLDTGCCWGGKLTLMRWEDKFYTYISSKMI